LYFGGGKSRRPGWLVRCIWPNNRTVAHPAAVPSFGRTLLPHPLSLSRFCLQFSVCHADPFSALSSL
jgi:hypothetical protein